MIWLTSWVLVSFVEMGLGGYQMGESKNNDLVKNALVAYFYQTNKPKLIQNVYQILTKHLLFTILIDTN